jgi:hypothetical protein
MRIADSIERNGLDVQMADLERIVGPAFGIEAETGELVARRLAEAVARFDGVFMRQKPKVSARRFIQEPILAPCPFDPGAEAAGIWLKGLSHRARRKAASHPAA